MERDIGYIIPALAITAFAAVFLREVIASFYYVYLHLKLENKHGENVEIEVLKIMTSNTLLFSNISLLHELEAHNKHLSIKIFDNPAYKEVLDKVEADRGAETYLYLRRYLR